MSNLSRRDFLRLSGLSISTLSLSQLGLRLLAPIDVINPLESYPDRNTTHAESSKSVHAAGRM